jgi:hypothetical protein
MTLPDDPAAMEDAGLPTSQVGSPALTGTGAPFRMSPMSPHPRLSQSSALREEARGGDALSMRERVRGHTQAR